MTTQERKYEMAMLENLNKLNEIFTLKASLIEAQTLIGELQAKLQEQKNNGEQSDSIKE